MGQATRPARPKDGRTFLHNHADGIAAMDLFRRADNLVSSALWTADRGAPPTTDRMASASLAHSDRRMDCKSDYGSFRLGTGSPTILIRDPRSGLWQCPSSDDFDRWAFATDQRRHAPRGKMDVPNG